MGNADHRAQDPDVATGLDDVVERAVESHRASDRGGAAIP
jgi:hypothetical protein